MVKILIFFLKNKLPKSKTFLYHGIIKKIQQSGLLMKKKYLLLFGSIWILVNNSFIIGYQQDELTRKITEIKAGLKNLTPYSQRHVIDYVYSAKVFARLLQKAEKIIDDPMISEEDINDTLKLLKHYYNIRQKEKDYFENLIKLKNNPKARKAYIFFNETLHEFVLKANPKELSELYKNLPDLKKKLKKVNLV